ncbi:MAG: ABC transporter ATP-binding protein [Bacillota bacterium]|nr:ABC transporter ATP-binding protein [Bacillota bacterium]
MPEAPLLEVRELHAGYGKAEVLEGVSLTVQPGEFVALVGNNGAGKSTLLKAVMGLVRGRGQILYRARELLGTPAHLRAALGIGYVPEGRRVFPGLTVEENLKVGAYRLQQEARLRQQLERIYAIFPRLAERRRQVASSLSGGEQQMLAIGRALMLDPSLLIVDEISMGLAPAVVDEILRVLEEKHRSGLAILLADQNARKMLAVADRGYVLETGRITLAGRAGDLRRDPSVVEAYLRAL